MATRFAIASGNWSNPAIWDSGALPVPGDDVYANGYTIAVDQNITVSTINNTTSPVYVPNCATDKMTGNLSPATTGYVFRSSVFNNVNEAYNAFDQNESTSWIGGTRGSGILGYKFNNPKVIKRYSIRVLGGAGNFTGDHPYTWTFDGSNDGSTWTNLESITAYVIGASGFYISNILSNTNSYLWYRLSIISTINTSYEPSIKELGMTESISTVLGGVSGGGFTLAAGYTINADLIARAGSTGTLLSYTASSPTIATINGNITLSGSTGTTFYLLSHTGTGTLNINGNISSVYTTGAITAYGIYCAVNNGTINVNGNVTCAYFTNRTEYLFYVGSNFVVNIVGDVITNARMDTYTGGVALYIASVCTVNIIGDIYGSTATAVGTNLAYQVSAIQAISAATINITGNVYGPSSASSPIIGTVGVHTGISTSAATTLTITGNVINAGNFGPAVYSSSSSTVTITGNIVGSGYQCVYMSGTGGSLSCTGVISAGSANAVFVTSAAITSNLSGPFINTASGVMAVNAPVVRLTGSPTRWYLTNSGGGDRTLYSADFAPGYPNIQDVRSGVSYNAGLMTGTMVVPAASTVASGVPVDATTGTAFITSAQVGQAVWDYLIANIADPNSIGFRLKDASTVTTTGSQIQALNGL